MGKHPRGDPVTGVVQELFAIAQRVGAVVGVSDELRAEGLVVLRLSHVCVVEVHKDIGFRIYALFAVRDHRSNIPNVALREGVYNSQFREALNTIV